MVSKLKPPKNYRKAKGKLKCWSIYKGNSCKYLKKRKLSCYGVARYTCLRGEPVGWDDEPYSFYVCDGHKRADDKENM